MFRDRPDFPAVQGLAFGEGGLAQVAGPGVGRVPALPELDRTPDDTANWFWGPEAPGPSGSALCGWAGCFLIRGTHVLETVCHTRFPWDQRDGPLPQGRCLLARARRWPVVWGEGTLGCGPRQPSASGDLSLVCEKEGQPWGTELAVTGVFVRSLRRPYSALLLCLPLHCASRLGTFKRVLWVKTEVFCYQIPLGNPGV